MKRESVFVPTPIFPASQSSARVAHEDRAIQWTLFAE
jgi:hypothetical protein